MPTSPLTGLIETLSTAGLGDADLLGRFVECRDDAALAALVRRHGPMVWGVCRRLLGHHDAEDAFQAAFLVLARKAASVAPREAVGSFLYGVARRTALQARRAAARRRAREVPVAEVPDTGSVQPDRWPDARPLLDEELTRLPDIYRAVVVLCDLEGRTRAETARQLGVPEGTVAGRLARARAMLAKRLARRGVVFSGALAAALSGSASASAPPSLVASTITAAGVLAAGKAAATGAVSVEIVALTDGVIKAMFVTKLKSAVVAVMVLGTLGAGGTSLTYHMAAGQEGRKPAAGDPAGRTVAGRDGQKPEAGKPRADNKPASEDLGKIEPPGGVPLPLVKPGTKEIGVDQLNKVRERLQSIPEKDLERWVVELERIVGVKLKDGLPSPRQACSTDFAIRMSVVFHDLKWNAGVADKLYERACTMPTAEANAWKEAFEAVLKKEIGIKQTGRDEYSNLSGGPPWAVPLVLIPVDALHEGQKYSVGRGKKYLARLKQLTKDDIALWRDKVDKFGGTELDAAVNIILLDDFFSKETFQRDRFKAAVGRQDDKKPAVEEPVEPAAKQDKDIVTAWGEATGGLQAGLGFRPGEERVYSHGETVTLVVRVRNVGPAAVRFQYVWAFLVENPPAVTGPDGRPVPFAKTSAEGMHVPRTVDLAPGKEAELYELKLDPRPAGVRRDDNRFPTLSGAGRFHLRYERVFGPSSAGRLTLDPTLAKLATGKLELEVVPEPPAATGVKAPPRQGGAPAAGVIPERELGAANETVPGLVYGVLRDETNPTDRAVKFRHELVGKAVRVEGFARGQTPADPAAFHGNSQRVVYEGGTIFVRGVDFDEHKARGRLVGVTGVLRYHPPRRVGFQVGDAPAHAPGYYCIDAGGVELLDRVTDPVLMSPTLP